MTEQAPERDGHFLISKVLLGTVIAVAIVAAAATEVWWRNYRLYIPAGLFVAALIGWWVKGRKASRFYGHDVYIGWFLLCCGYGAWITWGYPRAGTLGRDTHPLGPLTRDIYPDKLFPSGIWAEFSDRDLAVTTALPAICVLIFTMVPTLWHATLSDVATRDRWFKEIANNSYYMGFLLTLAGLSSALLGMDFTEIENREVMAQAIAKCGAAISTTFVAVICRVVMLDAVGLDKVRKKLGASTVASWLKSGFKTRQGQQGKQANCEQCDATKAVDELATRLDRLPNLGVDDIRFRLGLLSRAASRAVRWRRELTQEESVNVPSSSAEQPSRGRALPDDMVQRQAARVINGYFGRRAG